MAEETKRASASELGLDDPEVLSVATELAPELFAALTLASRIPEDSYPITSKAAVAKTFAEVKKGARRLDLPGVSIAANDTRERFPKEFLPIEDRLDLVRKTYMAIVIAHADDARRNLEAATRGDLDVPSSHPLDLGALQ